MATARKRPRVPRLGLLVAGRPSRSSGPLPLRPCSEHTKDTCMLRVAGTQLRGSSPLLRGSAVICPFSARQDFIPEGGGAAGPSVSSKDFRRKRLCSLPGKRVKFPEPCWRRPQRGLGDPARASPSVPSHLSLVSGGPSSAITQVWLGLPGPQQCPAGLGCQLLLTNERHCGL